MSSLFSCVKAKFLFIQSRKLSHSHVLCSQNDHHINTVAHRHHILILVCKISDRFFSLDTIEVFLLATNGPTKKLDLVRLQFVDISFQQKNNLFWFYLHIIASSCHLPENKSSDFVSITLTAATNSWNKTFI